MLRRLLLLIALGAVAPGPAIAAGPPQPPPIPQPRLPNAAATRATFDVIVEGTVRSSQAVGVSGTNGICGVDGSTYTREDDTYGRGKGLRLAFTRFKLPGAPTFVSRLGSRSPAAVFTVVGSKRLGASGAVVRTGDPVACLPTSDKAGDEPGCGKDSGRVNLALAYVEHKLSLRVTEASGLPALSGQECGSNTLEGASGAPLFGWPAFPALPAEPLSPTLLFGHRHAFGVELDSGELSERHDSDQGPLAFRVLDTGRHRATVRFVRVKPA